MIRFVIPKFPPSVNSCYFHRGPMKIKKPAYRDFEALVLKSIPEEAFISKTSYLSVELDFYSNRWATKKGTPRIVDLDNLIKCTLDAIFRTQKEYGVSDAQIYKITAKKMWSKDFDEDCVVVKIFDMEKQ